MGMLSKCKCENCGINVEFDSSQLAPNEIRKGACPQCGIEMTFFNKTETSGLPIGISPEQLLTNTHKADKINTKEALKQFAASNVTNQTKSSSKFGNVSHKKVRFYIRGNLSGALCIPPIFVGACLYLGKHLANQPDNNFSGNFWGATGMVAFFVGIFALPAWIYYTFKTFSRQCNSCHKLDAMCDFGEKEIVGTKDLTQKETRFAFIQHQIGKPEEVIAYNQDVKVKEHTEKQGRKCVYCGNQDFHYSSYTSKN
jgi:hypothetical protein